MGLGRGFIVILRVDGMHDGRQLAVFVGGPCLNHDVIASGDLPCIVIREEGTLAILDGLLEEPCHQCLTVAEQCGVLAVVQVVAGSIVVFLDRKQP